MRNGCFSNFDPRSSTKPVRLGAGRAIFSRIQSACTAAGSDPDCNGSAIAAGVANSSAVARIALIGPVVIEIEPVVGRIPGAMFQPRGVTPDERRDVSGAIGRAS